jgi:hypothetical protein
VGLVNLLDLPHRHFVVVLTVDTIILKLNMLVLQVTQRLLYWIFEILHKFLEWFFGFLLYGLYRTI